MWRLSSTNDIQFVRDFVGHATAVTCLAKVDKKGRFLSASKDSEVFLWDSRFNCDDEDVNEHQVLLASFAKMDTRPLYDIAIIDCGSYVRPTDKVDMAMAAAMAKKVVKEGSASVSRAAKERHIIGCSCEFASISRRHALVKVWSMKQVDNDKDDDKLSLLKGCSVKVEMVQELKHNAVVESMALVRKKTSYRRLNELLTGDRMGVVRLWTKSAKNVLLPGTNQVWSCTRTFCFGKKKDINICTATENMSSAITSLTYLQGDEMFVTGSRGGELRVWKIGKKATGDTVSKEEMRIAGAHNAAVTAVRQGTCVEKNVVSFTSASEDGKVLSFAVPAAAKNSNPICFNAVNLNVANRYIHAEPIAITAFSCVNTPNHPKGVLVAGTTNGCINVVTPQIHNSKPSSQQVDALVYHRQVIEEETLTLFDIAVKMSQGGVENKNRKKQMVTYKNCFLGNEAVSYLVYNHHAASREDACALGNILATHLSLFECVTKSSSLKVLEDSSKSYYRFNSDFSCTHQPRERKGLKKHKTAPNLSSI